MAFLLYFDFAIENGLLVLLLSLLITVRNDVLFIM